MTTLLTEDMSLGTPELCAKLRELHELLQQKDELISELSASIVERDFKIDSQRTELGELHEKVKMMKCKQQPDDSAIVPMVLDLAKDKSFDKQVLSFGMSGKLQDSHVALEHIQRSFPEEDASSNFHEYAGQFVPHIMEDLRCTVSERLDKIEKKAEKPFAATVDTIKHQTNQPIRIKKKKHNRFQRDFSTVTLDCTAPQNAFPTFDHGFNKELVCVVLPSHNRSSKKLQFVLGIGSTDRETEDDDNAEARSRGDKITALVSFKVQLLSHDFALLEDHTYNVHHRETVTSLQWYWLAGLIPAQRMYEACAHGTCKPPFYRQYFSMQTKEWPHCDPNEPAVRKGLNEVQTSVVNRLVATNEPGMYSLIGPPGTGKTTTIVSVLLERVRRFPEQKILLTAPSNKAVQVVLQKLLSSGPVDMPAIGLVGANVPDELKQYCPALYTAQLCAPFRKIRAERSPLSRRQTVFLDALVSAIVHHSGILPEIGQSMADEGQLQQSLTDATALTGELERLYAVAECATDIDALKECMTHCISAVMSKTAAMEEYLLRKAQIVFCTLVASGRKNLSKIIEKFDTVILDEASQALIPATIIPFKFKPQLFILVGDPQQLPATVNSLEARQCGYADSLMLVLDDHHRADPTWAQMLTTQYRMHPAICKWTSEHFYGSRLHPAECVCQRVSPLDKLPTRFPLQNVPSAFVTMQSTELKQEDGSKSNTIEADMVVAVAKYLLDHAIKPAQIGIITFYAAQVQILKEKLIDAGVSMEGLAVSTVDGFQGDEKDFILVSCVRTCPSAGFLRDHRRINVALSRAKHARWVFGDAAKLGKSNSALNDFLCWIADPNVNTNTPATQIVQGRDLVDYLDAAAPPVLHTAVLKGPAVTNGSHQPPRQRADPLVQASRPNSASRGNARNGANFWESAVPGARYSKTREHGQHAERSKHRRITLTKNPNGKNNDTAFLLL